MTAPKPRKRTSQGQTRVGKNGGYILRRGTKGGGCRKGPDGGTWGVNCWEKERPERRRKEAVSTAVTLHGSGNRIKRENKQIIGKRLGIHIEEASRRMDPGSRTGRKNKMKKLAKSARTGRAEPNAGREKVQRQTQKPIPEPQGSVIAGA